MKKTAISKLEFFLIEWSRSYIVLAQGEYFFLFVSQQANYWVNNEHLLAKVESFKPVYSKKWKKKIHCPAKTWIYLTPYVCTELMFESRPFMYNKTFLKKILQKLAAHIFTLLMAPFTSKLVNYSRDSETLNFRKNSKSTSFSFENSSFTVFIHFSKTHCTVPQIIWMQKVAKEA